MVQGEALRDRTQAAIVDAASTLLSTRDKAPSMDEIASFAGIGRATLYRYFPTRKDLITAIAVASVEELAARVSDAASAEVAFDEAIARLSRALVATGGRFLDLARGATLSSDLHPRFEAEVTEPIRAVLRRGVATGALREDIPIEVLLDMFSGLIKAVLAQGASPADRSVEQCAAAAATVFLTGACR